MQFMQNGRTEEAGYPVISGIASIYKCRFLVLLYLFILISKYKDQPPIACSSCRTVVQRTGRQDIWLYLALLPTSFISAGFWYCYIYLFLYLSIRISLRIACSSCRTVVQRTGKQDIRLYPVFVPTSFIGSVRLSHS